MNKAWQWLAAAGAVTLGAWMAFQQRPSAPDAPASQPVVERTPARTPAPAPAIGEDTRAARRSAGGTDDSANATDAPATGDPGDDEPEAVPGQSTQTAHSETAKLPAFFRKALETPPSVPIEDLEEGSPQALQARLEREPRDEGWASRVEWQLENYLALREHNEALGSPSVLCGSTVCRVMATTSQRKLAGAPEADWHEMMSHLRYETVSNEFFDASEMIVFNAAEPDRVGFVTYLPRAQPEEQ